DDTEALGNLGNAIKPEQATDRSLDTHSTFDTRTTFDTRFVTQAASNKNNRWKKIHSYISVNKISVLCATLSFLIIIGVALWQLQPPLPKYVAIVPPTLSAQDMPESQQVLVQGTVYDAI